MMNVFRIKGDGVGKAEASDWQDLESAAAEVLQRVSSEPALRVVLYKILAFCEAARPFAEIEREILSFPEMKAALQSPQTLLSWLAQAGGIEPVAAEEEVPAWRTTPAGRTVVRSECPGNRLARLLAQNPVYRNVSLEILRSCVAPKTRDEIEAMLQGNPVLENPKVYASFFIEALEQAGGLEWDEKWRTTQAGKEVVNEEGSPDSPAKKLRS